MFWLHVVKPLIRVKNNAVNRSFHGSIHVLSFVDISARFGCSNYQPKREGIDMKITRCMAVLLAICLVAAGTFASASEPVASGAVQYGAYWRILLDIYEEFDDGYSDAEYLQYMLYDVDDNGVKELLVLAGTCEADYMWRIYTIVNNEVQYMDEIFGGHSMLFACPEGGLYNMMGHMGCEEIYRVMYTNQAFTEELISSKELAEDEDYSNPGEPIPTAWITDDSLLRD